jgi:DNA-binding transcriptional LysR family regulator
MNLSAFDMNLLRVLDALLETGSTVKAGERIGLSQPAVSAALGRLRGHLGDPLFIRRGQRLEPTDFARNLAVPLREALDGLSALLAGPEVFEPATVTMTFRISGSDFFAELLMPVLAERLGREAPGIRLQLLDLGPENMIERVERDQAEVALMPDVPLPDWVETLPLFTSGFAMIARAGHPRLSRAGVAPGGVVPLDLFCDLAHVLMSPEGRLRSFTDGALETLGRARHVSMTLPTFAGVARVVEASDQVAVIPRQLARHFARLPTFATFGTPIEIPAARIVMAWNRRSTAAPPHRWMRDRIAETLAPLNAGEEPL